MLEESEDMEVLSRKSWVIAIPIEANASDVRSQARNVRSIKQVSLARFESFFFFEGLL